jgi:hypothetical protein
VAGKTKSVGRVSSPSNSHSFFSKMTEAGFTYSDVQKSVPVKLARLLLDITIGFCFDSHPRIDSVLQKSGFRYGLLENAIARKSARDHASFDRVPSGSTRRR